MIVAPLQCFACSKRQEFLRILSDNIILIKSSAIILLQICGKMTANNPNVDLVGINSYIKFSQKLSIRSQDFERNRSFGTN